MGDLNKSAQTAMKMQAPANVISVGCPEPTAALCGYLPVPLDRRHPAGAQVKIYFEVYPHSNPGPAESAIMANFGGPGVTTNGERDFAQFLFAANMDAHDLLLIDDRGRGLSGTIECDELQHGTAPFDQAQADCAAQLGAAASFYGSGDIAADMEQVRAALGYDKVDYFGASYGGVDVTAYATRFGEHLRSVVMDAPVGTPAQVEFARLQYRAHSDPRMVNLVCTRSLLCGPDHANGEKEFADLVKAVRLNPVEGDTHDAFGDPVHIRVDEDALLNFVVTYPSGGIFTSTGEILAAAAALKGGDTAPLLRLAAEGQVFFGSLIGDSGDPTFYSAGSFYATGCVDAGQPWDWDDPVNKRMTEYDREVAELPSNYFAPFSKDPVTGILNSTLGKQCFWWERPTPSSPMAPKHAVYPNTPTLVLDGDIDNRVPLEETMDVARLFPNSSFVKFAEVGHYTVEFSPCAEQLVATFIESLNTGDTSCANEPFLIYPAVGRFPKLVQNARAAEIDPNGNNEVNEAERKAATVAVATAIDALQRSNLGSGSSFCLRGGTFQTNYDLAWTTTLANCAFASDLVVSGSFVFGAFTDGSLVGDFTVSGAGTAGGTIHVSGFWLVPGPITNLSISGMLGGKQVAVLIPNA
jgi:pimeloyl-ACP methyl ester carboxylesterase